ncbi:MAG: hypothetical protein EOM87_00655 [Clostridia bacterium]|nr:hypothetical protein [Clostridia bacterium]
MKELDIEKMFETAKKIIEQKNADESYLARCKPYKALCDEYVELYRKYENDYEIFKTAAEGKTSSTQYAKGGIHLHRGFYSPSYTDLYTGNINRGRLLKKKPKSGSQNFEYIFNENNELICVKLYLEVGNELRLYSTEFLIDEQDELWLEYEYWDGIPKLFGISRRNKNTAEDKIFIRYERAMSFSYRDCMELHIELSEFLGDIPDSLLNITYFSIKNALFEEKML